MTETLNNKYSQHAETVVLMARELSSPESAKLVTKMRTSSMREKFIPQKDSDGKEEKKEYP